MPAAHRNAGLSQRPTEFSGTNVPVSEHVAHMVFGFSSASIVPGAQLKFEQAPALEAGTKVPAGQGEHSVDGSESASVVPEKKVNMCVR